MAKLCDLGRGIGRVVLGILALGLVDSPASAATRPAPAPATLRAVDSSKLVVPPGRARLEEIVTLSGDLPAALRRVPVGGQLRVADWPVSPGARRAVTLVRHDIYAADAKIVKIAPEGEIEVPRSRWFFFWGTDEDAGSRVVVSLDPDAMTLQAMTISDDGVSELTKQTAGPSLRYRLGEPAAEVEGAEPPSWTCGAEALPPPPLRAQGESALSVSPESIRPEATESITKSAVVAIDTDNEYMLNRFNNDTTAAVNWIASLITNTNVIYERDVSLHLFQGYTILRVSTVADPYVQAASGNADGNKLNEFGNYWSAHYGGVKRTVAAMLSGKQPGGGASGIAWISGLCSSGVGYSFNQLFTSQYLFGDTLIFGHEVGHNFGSPHTHCYPDPKPDKCYASEAGCYSGTIVCPSPLNINGYNATGTLMSYCHLSPCSSSTTLAFHPVTISNYFTPNIAGAASCIFGVGGSLPSGPTVTGISPPSGSVAGGTSVTITGSNFSANAKVAFVDLVGSVSLTVGTISSGSITATTPAHATGKMDVVVMNSDFQTGTLANSFTYGASSPAPTVSAVTPSFGQTTGGAAATIVGTNFQSGATVFFGGVAGTGVAFVNASTLTATTPAHAAGAVSVVVTNPDTQNGTLASGFTYLNGARFYTLTPCRVIDTRNASGPLGGPALAANADRVFNVTGQCAIPVDARAIAVNLTVTQATAAGDLKISAAGGVLPAAVAINYFASQTRANNTVAPIGNGGGVAVHCDQASGTVQFVLDVSGYYR